jgi:hypothetical protein
MKNNFKGGMSENMTAFDVAKKWKISPIEFMPILEKGTEHEMEHTDNEDIARRIALDHIVERLDYYDKLEEIEKMKKGGVLETPTTLNDIVLYYEKKGNWLFAKGNFYAWLYDISGVGKKVESGEYDFIMFPPMGKGSPFSDRYVPPLLMVWQKTYQKNYKGSEHLLGIVKGFYDEDKNQLIIEMMTTNPKFRRQGINAHLIKQLRTEFGVSQEDVIFDKPTKQGKLFEISKKYNLGGETDRNFNDKELLRKYKNEESIGFTAIAHLKSKGLIPRADGQKRKSEKYMEKGGRTIAQTPAPASDRVSGSKTNPKGSASDTSLARSIKFNDSLLKAIENKVKAHNEEYPSKKVTTPTAKAVVRRGMGAYSKSHRPFITGGAPNSRQAWGLARLNKFLLKKRGVKVKSAYIQDDDLL